MYFFIHGGGRLPWWGGAMRKKSEIGGGHTIFKLHSSKSHQPPLPHKKWTVPYLSARCLMLNWLRRHAFIYVTKTWNLWVFFLQFFESFLEKKNKNILQDMKNGLSQSATITSDIVHYILMTWAFHKLCFADKTVKCTPRKRTILLFFFNSKRHGGFS